MISGMLGKKLGMTQIFEEDGVRVPVTVLEAGPCQVQSVKSEETDGYNAVQLGYEDTKEKRVKKPQREYLKAKNLTPKKFVKEIRSEEAAELKVGDQITNSIFQKGDFVDITGISKGKGFQGVVKRHGFAGSLGSHGGSSMQRRPGSIGQSSYPSRVFKGMKMPGHMGVDQITVQNVEIIEVNLEDNTVIVKGAVPGSNGTYLVIKYAKKKPLAEREEPVEPEVEVTEEAAPEAEAVQAQETASAEAAPAAEEKPTEEAAPKEEVAPAAEEKPAEEAAKEEKKEEDKEGSKE